MPVYTILHFIYGWWEKQENISSREILPVGKMKWWKEPNRNFESKLRKRMISFWNYCFYSIYMRYYKWGEVKSAHFFSICVLSFLAGCNFLSISTFLFSKTFLNSRSFERLLIISCGTLLLINFLYFIRKRQYLRIISDFQITETSRLSNLKKYFICYFVVTIVLLILAFVE